MKLGLDWAAWYTISWSDLSNKASSPLKSGIVSTVPASSFVAAVCVTCAWEPVKVLGVISVHQPSFVAVIC
eukprot:7380233-Prymnesium_polylepis.2